jgi:ParB family chromosome partitioning protein
MVFHDEAMIQLKDSISSAGVLQPIAVRKNPDDSGRYQLIAGERRTIAARSLGLKEIPAVILKVDDSDLAAQSLAENIVRDDLSDFEIGTALSRMLTEFPSKVQLAQSFGVSRSQLYRFLSFASLPKFIIDDLEKNPALLGGSISKDLVPLVSGADPKFLAELKSAWQDVKLGKISQNQLIDRTNQLNSPTAKILNGSRVKQALTFNGHKHGVFTADDTNTIVKFKSSSLSTEKSKELLNFLNVFISTL